jgi:hypothetical protein
MGRGGDPLDAACRGCHVDGRTRAAWATMGATGNSKALRVLVRGPAASLEGGIGQFRGSFDEEGFALVCELFPYGSQASVMAADIRRHGAIRQFPALVGTPKIFVDLVHDPIRKPT